jgi:hypothetical protein
MLDGLDLVLRWYLDDVRGRFPDSPVLLCDESGGRMAAATIRNRLRHLMTVEGRPEAEWFSPHGMRRACATHNYERGVDLVAIQQLLGHWTVASTMRYVYLGNCIRRARFRRSPAEWAAAMLLRHRLDTRFNLRCLDRSPVGCMILALKCGIDSGLGAVWDGRIWRVRRISNWSPAWCSCARKTLRWRRC